MKRKLAVVLSLLLALCLTACGSSEEEESAAPEEQEEEVVEETQPLQDASQAVSTETRSLWNLTYEVPSTWEAEEPESSDSAESITYYPEHGMMIAQVCYDVYDTIDSDYWDNFWEGYAETDEIENFSETERKQTTAYLDGMEATRSVASLTLSGIDTTQIMTGFYFEEEGVLVFVDYYDFGDSTAEDEDAYEAVLQSLVYTPSEEEEDAAQETEVETDAAEEEEEEVEEEEKEEKDDGATLGEKNALGSAESYLRILAFSYDSLIEQLEYEGYSEEEATYAADNCGADWNEQAAKCAESYLDTMSFSRDGLIEQLEYEGFTNEQAVYGVEACGY